MRRARCEINTAIIVKLLQNYGLLKFSGTVARNVYRDFCIVADEFEMQRNENKSRRRLWRDWSRVRVKTHFVAETFASV